MKKNYVQIDTSLLLKKNNNTRACTRVWNFRWKVFIYLGTQKNKQKIENAASLLATIVDIPHRSSLEDIVYSKYLKYYVFFVNKYTFCAIFTPKKCPPNSR